MSIVSLLFFLHYYKKSMSHFNSRNGINSRQDITLSIAPVHLLGVLLFISLNNLPNNNCKNILFSLFNLQIDATLGKQSFFLLNPPVIQSLLVLEEILEWLTQTTTHKAENLLCTMGIVTAL